MYAQPRLLRRAASEGSDFVSEVAARKMRARAASRLRIAILECRTLTSGSSLQAGLYERGSYQGTSSGPAFLPSLRDSLMIRSYPGLTPWANYVPLLRSWSFA